MRALFARFLILCHIGLSIFVLYHVKQQLQYLIPIIGAVLVLAESIVVVSCFKGTEPVRWFSPIFFLYVTTIVTCIWLLELENVTSLKRGDQKGDFKPMYFDTQKLKELKTSTIVSTIKVIWSQLEVQIFFALLMIIRWLIPKSHLTPHGLSDILFKYFAISCDMLDFLSVLQDSVLIKNDELIYSVLAIWTLSTCQFFLYVPKIEDEEKRKFNAYITNSLLSVLLLDLPYLGVRIAAIFAFGSHNYNSYFFATKNCVMILLQIIRIRATFSERRIRMNRNAKELTHKIGFDKESQKLYNRELDVVPIKNYRERFRTAGFQQSGHGSRIGTPTLAHQTFTVPQSHQHTDV